MSHRALNFLIILLSLTGLPCAVMAGALDRGVPQQRYNQAADEMIRVPGTLGMWESDALAVLQQAGVEPSIVYARKYRKDLAGKEGTVIDQDPGAAGITMLGSTVSITVYWPHPKGKPPEKGNQGGNYDQSGTGQQDGVMEPGPAPGQAAPPNWGGTSQPGGVSQPASGGGWVPPPSDAPGPGTVQEIPQPSSPPPVAANPVPSTTPRAEQRGSTPPPTSAAPVQQRVTPVTETRQERQPIEGVSVTATPVQPTATRSAQEPGPSAPTVTMTPVEQTVIPVTGTREESQPSEGVSVTATPVEPTATQAQQQDSAPAPFVMTPVQETATPVRQQRSTGPAPVAATPVEPTATQAQQETGSSTPVVTMTPVQQTVTPIAMSPAEAAPSPTPAAGRVQIKIIKFEAVQDTDDPKRDGTGDEIIVAFRGLWYLKNSGRALREFTHKSAAYKGITRGRSVSMNLTVFDEVMGSDQELIFYPTIWEEDSEYYYLDKFMNEGRVTSDITHSSWNKASARFTDPEVRLDTPGPGTATGTPLRLLPFNTRYCAVPAEKGPMIALEGYQSDRSISKLNKNYTLPVGFVQRARSEKHSSAGVNLGWRTIKEVFFEGYKFSINWSFIDKVRGIDCGFGPGVVKLRLESKDSDGQKLSEYNMYIQFVVSPG
jgi:hypothetical protein